jgi:membrane-associated phospholipid phosphatase
MKKNTVVLLLQLMAATAFAQDSAQFQKDLYIPAPPLYASKKMQWIKAAKAPVVLTALSLFSFTDNETLDRAEFKELRDEVSPTFRHHVDDYLQYAPIAAVYGLNMAGIKGRHDLANRTALMVKSGLLVAAITFPLKNITAVPRPDTGERNSFPSGHTATAFAAATFMAKEYGHMSKWYSIGAYTVATSVGVMRVMNNRHWITDTLAGAAIGILSTNVVYLTHQYKWGRTKKHHNQTIIVPSYDGRTGMVSVVHVLH